METIQGKKSVYLDREELRKIIGPFNQVTVDIGTGDGKFAYELAKKNPGSFFIGVDAERSNLEEYSARAIRKPHKGGAANLIYTIANAENMPDELSGLADLIWIVLPWGSLLKGFALAQENLLNNIVKIAAPGALLKAVLTYELRYEAMEIEKLGLPGLSPGYVDEFLAPRFRQWGISIGEKKFLTNRELKNIASTWAKRLGFGKTRVILYIQAVINPLLKICV